MTYIKTNFNPDSAPGISADILNKIENGIVANEQGMLRILEESHSVSSTVYTNVSSIDDNKNIVAVQLSLSDFEYDDVTFELNKVISSPIFELNLSASSSAIGYIYVSNPGTTSTTKYLIRYYFDVYNGNKRLFVISNSAIVDFDVRIKWIYKEV